LIRLKAAAPIDAMLVSVKEPAMGYHRMIGAGLMLLGLSLLFGQLALLYGSSAERDLMVAMGLPGVAILSSAGAICFGCGCLLVAAPGAVIRHMNKASSALRRRR
jgi:hypothetical protein